MNRKLKPWPNGLGYDYGKWELLAPLGDEPWQAIKKGGIDWHNMTVLYGRGATWEEAIQNAKPSPIGC